MQAQLHYARHFALLASIAGLLAVTTVWRAPAGIDIAFASYGAFHAGSLTASLRSPPSHWRRVMFVVAAAVVSVLATHAGIAFFWSVRGFSQIMFFTAIAVSSIAGAVAYGLLLRSVLDFRFPIVGMAMAPAVSAPAALAAYAAGGLNQLGLWVAVAWWFAFSGWLWYADGGRLRFRG